MHCFCFLSSWALSVSLDGASWAISGALRSASAWKRLSHKNTAGTCSTSLVSGHPSQILRKEARVHRCRRNHVPNSALPAITTLSAVTTLPTFRLTHGRVVVALLLLLLVAIAHVPLFLLQSPVASPTRSIKEVQQELLNDFNPSLRKVWQCNQVSSSNAVVIFVHVFKAAGSSLREMFRKYGDVCQASCATLIHCSGLSGTSMAQLDSTWVNRYGQEKGKACHLKNGKFRNRTAMQEHQTATSRYIREHVDLLIGHLPVGTHETWNKDSFFDTRITAQYITFVRKPMQKYVSGMLFTTKGRNLSFNETVNLIRDRVNRARAADEYYEGYTAYLTSPKDKHVAYNVEPGQSIEERVRTILHNLVQYPFVVGSVENMYESLEMIQYTIDNTREATELFGKFGMTREPAKETYRANESTLSTSAIVDALRQDSSFWPQLEEYLKYDKMVYDFGLSLHKKQYRWLTYNRL